MKNLRLVILPLFVVGLLAATMVPAEAQRRGGPRHSVVGRSSVVLVGGYWYPRYYYNPFYDYGYPYGPFSLYPSYGYGYYDRRDELTSSIRLQVTPSDTEVFVDGYAAGQVDDFDGVFQRLRVKPGSHEITLYREGYRTIRQNLYLNPRSDQKIKFALEKVSAGETSELPPPPPEGAETANDDRQPPPPERQPFDGTRRQPGPPPERQPSSSRFGTLAVRMQPGDAELLIDGERWDAPAGQDRIAVQLAEGRHHVEVSKAGFSTYREDVLIRANNTLSLNVSLLRGDASPAR